MHNHQGGQDDVTGIITYYQYCMPNVNQLLYAFIIIVINHYNSWVFRFSLDKL